MDKIYDQNDEGSYINSFRALPHHQGCNFVDLDVLGPTGLHDFQDNRNSNSLADVHPQGQWL